MSRKWKNSNEGGGQQKKQLEDDYIGEWRQLFEANVLFSVMEPNVRESHRAFCNQLICFNQHPSDTALEMRRSNPMSCSLDLMAAQKKTFDTGWLEKTYRQREARDEEVEYNQEQSHDVENDHSERATRIENKKKDDIQLNQINIDYSILSCRLSTGQRRHDWHGTRRDDILACDQQFRQPDRCMGEIGRVKPFQSG